MIRSALLLCAALLAAACFGCAIPVQGPQLSVMSGMQARGCTPGNGASFATAVQYLNGFNPRDPGQAPTGATGLPPPGAGTPNYAQALQTAFQLAPGPVQTQLCALDGVYVNEGACAGTDPACFNNGWGYRAVSDKKWYIAIPAGLWSHSQPYKYHQYESDILQEVYGWNPSWSTYIPPPTYNSANAKADNFDMTVLAALAHELGHVEWYKMMKPTNPGDDYDPNKFCNSTFFSTSWAGTVRKPPRWRLFADHLVPDQHLQPPQISVIDAYLWNPDVVAIDTANILLDQLYQWSPTSYPWASYFAALSPDEDFVETFKFYVLTNANTVGNEGPLKSLELQVNYYTRSPTKKNIPDDYLNNKKPELSAKVKCITDNL